MTIAWIAPALRPRRESPDRRARRQAHRRRFALEQFEDRTLLSTFQWIGTAPGNWAAPENWDKTASTNSNTVPGPGDTAIIDDASAKVTISGNAAVAHLTLQDGSVTLDDDAKLAISNNLSIGANTTFNASAGTVTFGPSGFSNVTIDESASASFGNVTLAKTNPGHDLTLNGTMNLDGDLTINGINLMNGGDIYVGGDVHANDTSVSGSTVIHLNHDATIYGDGALPWVQVDDGAAVTANDTPEPLNLLIKSGSFTASDNLKVKGAITVDEGASLTVPGKLTLTSGSSDAKIVIKPDSAVAVKDLTIHKGDGNGRPFSLPDGELSITGDLAIVNVASMRGGQINVAGNVTTTDATITSAGGEPTWIHLGANGSPHTISGGGALPGLLVSGGSTTISDDLQVVKLNITGGTLKAPAGNLGISWDFTQTGGTFNANGGTVLFNGASDARISIGATKLNNVELDKIPSKSLIIQNAPLNLGGDFTILETKDITGAIHVGGNLTSNDASVGGNGVITMTGGGSATINGGAFPLGGIVISKIWSSTVTVNIDESTPLGGPLTINTLGKLNGVMHVAGNVMSNDSSVPGNALVVFNGTGAQKLIAGVNGGQIPGLKFDKTSGSVTLVDNGNTLAVTGGWEAVGPTLVNTANTTVQFAGNVNNYSTRTIDTGVNSFNNVEINGVWSDTLKIQKMDIAGNLTINEVGTINGPGAITLAGNVTSNDSSVAGNAVLILNGTGIQTIASGVSVGVIPGLEINKPSGSVTLDPNNVIGVNGGWEVASTNNKKVEVNTAGSTVRFVGNGYNYANRTINAGKYDFGNVQLNLVWSNVLNVAGDMKMTGGLTINEVGKINAAPGAITVAGDLISKDDSVGGGADITMIGSKDARIEGGDFPNGGIVIKQKGSATVHANVLKPLAGPLVLTKATPAKALTGTFQVANNVTSEAVSIDGNDDGSPVLVFMGNKKQTLSTGYGQMVPGVKFDKTGGSVDIESEKGELKVSGGWLVSSGNAASINIPDEVAIRFDNAKKGASGDREIDTGESAGFKNVILTPGGGSTMTITKMVINGNLNTINVGELNGEPIDLYGNLITQTVNSGMTGDGAIRFVGSNDQTIMATGNARRLPNVIIEKGTGDGAGTLSVAEGSGWINVMGNWDYRSGNVDMTGSTIRFAGTGFNGNNNYIRANGMIFATIHFVAGDMDVLDDDAEDGSGILEYTGSVYKPSKVVKGRLVKI